MPFVGLQPIEQFVDPVVVPLYHLQEAIVLAIEQAGDPLEPVARERILHDPRDVVGRAAARGGLLR